MNLLTLPIGESIEVMYLSHGQPLPEGYEPVDSGVVDCHHKSHSRIVARASHVKQGEER